MALCDVRSRAPITLVVGHVKLFINDVSTFPAVLASLTQAQEARHPTSTYTAVHDAADTIRNALSLSLGTHCGTLKDGIFHARNRIPSGLLRRLRRLNDVDSFLRHSTSTSLVDLVAETSTTLSAGLGSLGHSPSIIEPSSCSSLFSDEVVTPGLSPSIIQLSLDDFVTRSDIWRPLVQTWSHEPSHLSPTTSSPPSQIIHHDPEIYDASSTTSTLDINNSPTKTASSGPPVVVIPSETSTLLGGDFRSLPNGVWQVIHRPFASTPSPASSTSSADFSRELAVQMALNLAEFVNSEMSDFWASVPVVLQIKPSSFRAFEKYYECINQFKNDLPRVSRYWSSLACVESHLRFFSRNVANCAAELARAVKSDFSDNFPSPVSV
jgi:hypothetical protein